MEIKKCGLYSRVSTERQSQTKAGSIETQIDRMKQYISFRQSSSSYGNEESEVWRITDIYREEGKSGKNTERPELQRLISDIKRDRINTVICTKIDRITRSLIDFYKLHEIFTKHTVDFISLEENFDTSTPMGEAMLKMTLVWAELERGQTSARTKDKMLWRAEQGLWNGGHILGYDLIPDKKGYLEPNKEEAQIINLLFNVYLDCGSVLKTAQIVNSKGYTPKRYTAKRSKKLHAPQKFCYSSALNILTNRAYIGEIEANKKKRKDGKQQRIVHKAKWPAIVEKSKFKKVQELLKENLKHKNNGARPNKHHYTFNYGLLRCHKCGARMEGRNGHGHGKKIYYYYYCTNRECFFKVSEKELELTVQKLIGISANDSRIFCKIVENLNEKMKQQLPALRKQKELLTKERSNLKSEATHIISNFANIDKGKLFVNERLSELEERGNRLNSNIEQTESEIKRLDENCIEDKTVRKLLLSLDEVFKNHVKPYQKRKLLRWLLDHVRISDKKLSIGVTSEAFRSDIASIFRADGVFETTSGSHVGRGLVFATKL